MDISSRTARGEERLGLAFILAIIIHFADKWIGSTYKKIYTYIHLVHQIGLRIKTGSPTSAIIILFLSITTIRTLPGNLTAFFGVDLCFDLVLAIYIRHLDLDITDEEFRGEILNGPIATFLYIFTTSILRNGFGFYFRLLGTCLSVLVPNGTMFHLLEPYLDFITPSHVKLVTKVLVYVILGKLLVTRRRRKDLLKEWGWEAIKLSVRSLAWVIKTVLWVVMKLSFYCLIKPIWFMLQHLSRGIAALRDSIQQLNLGSWKICYMHIMEMLSAPRPNFKYNQLAAPRKIRLLKLLRQLPLTEVRCELIEVDLDNPPPFEAISYTWRNETFNTPILVNDRSFKCTTAVHEILSYRQSFAGSRLMWIDAICINQSSPSDKNQQVQLMRDIYHHASRVIVWLGPQNQALDASEFRWMLLRLAASKTLDWYNFTSTIHRNDLGWMALANLLAHPWFERAWIIQEVAMGRTVHVIYGNVCFKWDTIASGVTELMDAFTKMHTGVTLKNNSVSGKVMDKRDHLSNIAILTRFQKAVRKNEFPSLENALMDCTKFLAGDARDKVFALLGISNERDGTALRPDYDKSTEHLYMHVMQYLLSRNSRTPPTYRAIELAGIGYPRAAELENVLPSWVVDWSSTNHGQITTEAISGFNHRQQQGVPIVLYSNPRILILTGNQIDILHVSENQPFRPPNPGRALQDSINWYLGAKSLAKKHCQERYLDDYSFHHAFWNTLTGRNHQQHKETSKAFWEFENLIEEKRVDVNVEAEGNMEDGKLMSANKDKVQDFLVIVLGRRCQGKRFCVTEDGRMALVPPNSKSGDLVCQINGVRLPLLLRKWKFQYYELVGACYVHNLVDREGSQEYLIK